MSEYQYVGFRAIDSGVSEKGLQHMRQQSTRAEITPWLFKNEYHFGDFHGNAVEMLRRGYDIHVHYANYGIRRLLIRLPNGLPYARAAKPYLDRESLRFHKDKRGRGGALAISPFHEPGDIDEFWDLGELLDRLVPLRAEILDGDLRPSTWRIWPCAMTGTMVPTRRSRHRFPPDCRSPRMPRSPWRGFLA